MKSIIISGGHIDDGFALEWLQKNKYDLLIAADSGMDFLYRNGIVPDVIAGDFDSVSGDAYEFFVAGAESTREKEIEILRLNPVKDDTDTEFVTREAVRRGATSITILGATGTRLDHMLANVYLLGIGLEEGVTIQLVDAHNRIRMITDAVVIGKNEQFGQFVSFLPVVGEAKGVTLEGFKYPLKDATIKFFSSLGISNEIVEEKANVQIKEGVLLMIESRD